MRVFLFFFIITVIIIIILSFQGVFDFSIVFPCRIFFFQPLCSKWLWHSSENVTNIYNTLYKYIIPTYSIKCYTILLKNIHFRAFFLLHCCILFAFVTKHFDNNDNFLLRKISLLYCVIHCFHLIFLYSIYDDDTGVSNISIFELLATSFCHVLCIK